MNLNKTPKKKIDWLKRKRKRRTKDGIFIQNSNFQTLIGREQNWA